jgi:hypothetical protein
MQKDRLWRGRCLRTSTVVFIRSLGRHGCAGHLKPRGRLLPELSQNERIVLFTSPAEELKQHNHEDDSDTGDCKCAFTPDMPLAREEACQMSQQTAQHRSAICSPYTHQWCTNSTASVMSRSAWKTFGSSCVPTDILQLGPSPEPIPISMPPESLAAEVAAAAAEAVVDAISMAMLIDELISIADGRG